LLSVCALTGCQLIGYDKWVDAVETQDADVAPLPDGGSDDHPASGIDARVASDTGADASADVVAVCQHFAASGSQMIADFERGSSELAFGDGYAYAFSDGSAGTLEPSTGARLEPTVAGANGTKYAARFSGSGFSMYAGALLRPDLSACPIDATNTRGIGFWIKGAATDKVSVQIATVQTTDKAYCGEQCNDHFAATYDLTDQFEYHVLPWSGFQQEGWGVPATFDPSQIVYFQFSFGPLVTFDLSFDELSFY
jgi:hypothetical protein